MNYQHNKMAAVGSKIRSTPLYRVLQALVSGGKEASSAPVTIVRRKTEDCRIQRSKPANSKSFHTFHDFVPLQRDTGLDSLARTLCTYVCLHEIVSSEPWLSFSGRRRSLLLFAFWWKPIILTRPWLPLLDRRAGCWKGKSSRSFFTLFCMLSRTPSVGF